MTFRSVALPTEHGGWGFTLEPILLGLLVAPTATGWELAVAATAVFLARRPVKLITTDLVRRRWLERSNMALSVAGLYGLLAIAGAVGAFVTRNGPFWWPLIAAVPFALVSLRADAHSRNRGLVPQLCGAVAMGSTVAAIAMGAGWDWGPSFGLWGVLAARDLAAIVLARGMVRRFKSKAVPHGPILWLQIAAILATIGFALTNAAPWMSVVAMVLLAMTSVISLHRPPVPAKMVGWTQMAVGMMVVLLTALGVRVGF
jgi:hypothetical protein